eukprot:4224911-Pyramimonas_sp.AAC.1
MSSISMRIQLGGLAGAGDKEDEPLRREEQVLAGLMSTRDGLVRRSDFIGVGLTDEWPPRRRSCLVSAFSAFLTPRGGMA